MEHLYARRLRSRESERLDLRESAEVDVCVCVCVFLQAHAACARDRACVHYSLEAL